MQFVSRLLKLASIFALSGTSAAVFSEQTYLFNIPSQQLPAALLEFSRLSHQSYIASMQILRRIESNAVIGDYSPEVALQIMLQGNGLIIKRNDNGAFLILPEKPTASAIKPSLEIEEVIVTAFKREQLIHDIPISATAHAGESLEALGRTNIRDLFKITPSVSYHGAISSAGQAMYIRGVGSGVIATGIEQSVGTVIDSVVTGPSGSGLQELWDIDRVEVLRGPQGTMFGKNVSAGAVQYISKDPTAQNSIGLKTRYEFAKEAVRLDGYLNGALSESLNARISLFYLDEAKGDIHNVVRLEDENRKQRDGVRLKLHYAADNRWVHFNVAHDTVDDLCCSRVFSYIDEAILNDFVSSNIAPAIERQQLLVNSNNRVAITDGEIYERADTTHAVIELGAKLDSGYVIKSISGVRNWRHKSRRDADNLDIDIVWVADERDLILMTEEIQLISPSYRNYEYVLGAYYYHQNFPSTEYIGGGLDLNNTNGVTSIDSTVKLQNVALYGHSTYYFNDYVSAIAGIRFLKERINVVGQQQGDNWIWPTYYPVNQVDVEDKDYVARLGFQIHTFDDGMGYLTLTRGYKGSAVDNTSNSTFFRAPLAVGSGAVVSAQQLAVLDPEKVLNIELGYKSYYFNRSVFLSSVLFHSRFNDYQSSAYDGNTNSFRLQNAGVVVSQGVEFEYQFNPWQGAALSGFLAWVDARYERFEGVPCQVGQIAAGVCDKNVGQNVSGKRINETPSWQYYVEYQQDIALQSMNLFFNLNYAWRSSVIFDQDLDVNTRQASYGLLGMRMGWQVSNNYKLAAFGNNLLDKDYSHRIIDAPIWNGTFQRYPSTGREFGLEFSIMLN